MKLYYCNGTCSLAPRIALEESGLPYEAVRTVMATGGLKLPNGSDFTRINPLGYVPILELDDGRRLAENPAILMQIADLAPDGELALPAGTFERMKLLERLCFIASEIHKSFTPLFIDGTEAVRPQVRAHLRDLYAWLDRELSGDAYQFGANFTVADGYLFTTLTWTPFVKVDLSGFDRLAAFRERVAARPAVQRALALEKPVISKP